MISAIWAVSDLSSAPPWPGLSTGGTLWFADLTAPALDWAAVSAPMGMWGAVLPALAALVWRVNLLRVLSEKDLPRHGTVLGVPAPLMLLGMLRLQV